MFITENQNVGDSVLFLLSSREALANIVEATGTENAPELINFIYNEASDYEVMHLLVSGSLPEEKYNDVAEMMLFSEFKESMLKNHDFVTEMVGEDIFENILNEVDSLYMATSTAAPVLEFEAQTNADVALARMIIEVGGNIGNRARAAANSKATFMAKGDAARAAAAAKKKSAAALAAKKKMHFATSNVSTKAKAYALKNKLVGAVKSGKAAVQTKAKALGKAAYGMTPSGKMAAAGKAARTGQGIVGAAKPSAALVKGAKVQAALTKAAPAAGGAAGAALAIYAGAKIYKRFFSQAAKACAGQSGSAKTMCMNKYKKQAIMKQAAAIQSASGTCAKSKNPEKCKAGVATKVQSLKAKAAQIAA
jgi:hypothetical protein